MKKKIDNVHPRNANGNPYDCIEMCEVESGCHFCFKTSNEQTDFDKFGVGISLYFRFIKYLSVIFLILGIISLPMLIVNIMGKFYYFHKFDQYYIILTILIKALFQIQILKLIFLIIRIIFL